MNHLMLYENAFLGTILAATAIFFVYRKLFGKNPISLVKGWNTLHKKWSTWLVTIGTWLAAVPDATSHALSLAWEHLPPDLRGAIPPDVVQGIGIGIIALGVIASIIKQPSLTQIARPGGPLAIAPAPEPGATPSPAPCSGAVDAPDDDSSDLPPLSGEPNRVPPPPMVAPLAGLSGGVEAEPAVIVIPDGAKTS